MSLGALQGHFWTVAPWLRDGLVRHPSVGQPWSLAVDDARHGEVTLRGALHVPDGASTLVLLLHGMGGNADSAYVQRAAQAAAHLGLASLRLHLRGADGEGDDLYHAGLVSDLQAVLEAPRLRDFASVAILGFSLGGHLALKFAASRPQRVGAVAALCPPLQLQQAALAFDRRSRRPYRAHVLGSLKTMYAAVDRRGRGWVDVQRVQRIASMEAWDEEVMAPRFGFASARHYWQSVSVAADLADLAVDALLVRTAHDPFICDGIDARTPAFSERICWRELRRGGHLGFAPRSDLGFGQRGTVAEQALGWLRHRLLSTSSS